ncbi:probable serine/threonine-protein kinase At1g54610 isoform X2 [Spinacia oleracea]|uniref:Probable serine/threonine-protein kinase At1g54610 isoform X2 n=1 Tax=Spinacia oleracea TaxID=3562 RepID=A0ABM3RC79_SPIOL|nr:probable serine/threonine-protein kinase At1g54610 isoform X2 [Spinacia oleracea]
MGCVSSKPKTVRDGGGISGQRVPSKRISRTSSSREGGPQMMNRSDSRTSLIDRKSSNSIRICDDRSEKSRVKPEGVLVDQSEIRVVPKAWEGEQVAAGWPSWLVTAAADTITGWIPRRSDSFQRLGKIGEGTYSSVYKARDLIHGKIVALKRVRFDNLDQESVKFMSREILILRRLDHPNVIKLEGLIASTTSTSLYLIFEYMEHDLTGIASLPGLKFTEPQVKCFMQQLLSGLEYCHSHGVLHRDIKGSNLLINDSGTLKIADFGLATFFDPQKSLPLTSRVVTLWYRPPELLLGAIHYGISVDLWSAGCIFGELYAGKPIMPGRTEVEQLHKIFKLCGSPPEEYWEKSKLPHSTAFKPQRPYRRRVAERFQDISAPALALIETLLSIDPASRGTATSALDSEFFTSEPLACDPSTLPKYPPSKEIDARRREEEIRRRQASEGRHDKADHGRQGSQESATVSAKKRKSQSQSKPQNGLFRPPHEQFSSGPLLGSTGNSEAVKEVSKEIFDRLHQRGMYSGQSTRVGGWSNGERKLNDPPSFSKLPNLTTSSSMVPSRTSAVNDNRRKYGLSQNKKVPGAADRFSGPINGMEGVNDDDWLHFSGSTASSHQLEENTRGRRSTSHSLAPDNDRIHLSGPLLRPSKDLDQMLKEHDRRIQEAARRARHDKFKHSKVLAR